MRVHGRCVGRLHKRWLNAEKGQNIQPKRFGFREAGIVGESGIALDPPDR